MADTGLRASSLRVRFERGLPEPTDIEIFKFMKEKMRLNSEKLLSMYKDKSETSVIIKFKDEEDMRNTLRDLPETMVFDYNRFESTEVKLSSANVIVRYVRLFGLPPEVEDREISTVMVRYGKIVRMIREKYAEETGFPIWTSVRGVYLETTGELEVPASLYVRNLRARVSYEGLVNKCYVCGSKDHLKADCPEKKSINDRLQNAQGSSYSGILKSGTRWSKQQQPEQPTNSGRMVSLGQGPPKRTIAVQQQTMLEIGEKKTPGSEHGCEEKNDTALTNKASDDCSDMYTDDDTAAAGSEAEFTKIANKRGRKKKSVSNNTSDSDELPTGKVHREQTGTLSESLDRMTRSKAKQKKVSNQDECATEVTLTNEHDADLNGNV